jgi:GT2 family glycosyltransferase
MLRRILQRLVRLAPGPARLAWQALPIAMRARLGPLVHPIAAQSRRGALELVVEPPESAARFAVAAPADDGGASLEPYSGAGYPVHRLAEPRDIDRLLNQRVFDAVLVGGDASYVERARAAGWRTAPRGASVAELGGCFPAVSIVIPTFQNRQLCGYCLAAIAKNTAWPSWDVVVIDNGSRDGTAELVAASAAGDSRIRTITNRENLGFARAVNQGILSSDAAYVVVLNDDVVVAPGWLSRLVAHLEREENLALVGAVTNQIGNGARVPANYDSLDGMERLAAERAIEHAGELWELDVVALFCAAARRTALDSVGLLDERYELGMFEDDDLSRALRSRGFRIATAADAFVHHVGQATLSQLTDAEYLKLWEANKRRFEKKWRTRWVPPAVA